MTTFTKSDLLRYMRSCRLAVVSSIGSRGEPQSALVGIATTENHEVIFDTVLDSRKHQNLVHDPRTAIVLAGPGEKTLQFEGTAQPVSAASQEDAALLEGYFAVWPDGRSRLTWPNIAYWRVSPMWARYSDYDAGGFVQVFGWG
jgi:pyridoxine/pyridoxamine 5'-phosphate oxidase